ncbi:MAG: hypothetical protein M3P18_19225 [Actinomycetota bacterium]|nr:hypothetical protein [Actinomycetota bacterium]
MTIVDSLDSAVRGKVLIFGRLPPAGRDIDLLARPAEHDAIVALLRAEGFLNSGQQWIAFHGCEAQAVELVPAQAWNLPPEEILSLFAEARPFDHLEHLARPAPHHAVLISARRLAQGGDLSDRQREKVRAAQAEDSSCWQIAAEHAANWHAEASLADLQRSLASGRRVSRRNGTRAMSRGLRAVAPHRLHGRVVSLSGCDGAGKSSQAQALQAALDTAGIDAIVVWSPLGNFGLLDIVGKPIKKVLSLLRLGPFRRGAADNDVSSVMSTGSDSSSLGGAVLKNVWVTAIALLNALAQRRKVFAHTLRGRVVILDRSSLDAIVLMRFLYGEGHRFRFQRWLLRTLSAPVSLGFFLDVAPETLLARKLDWWSLDDLRRHVDLYREEYARFGVRHLDGELPQDLICTTIAAEAWRMARDDTETTALSPDLR